MDLPTSSSATCTQDMISHTKRDPHRYTETHREFDGTPPASKEKILVTEKFKNHCNLLSHFS